jgi:3-deoxy-D-manno-octulosonic-acid transferase
MRSEAAGVSQATDIYVADSMGELKMLYASADVAFVGGSLVAVGGHNVLEPALIGTPILFGPQMFNFKEIAERILAEQAAVQCQNVDEIAAAVTKIHADQNYKNMLGSVLILVIYIRLVIILKKRNLLINYLIQALHQVVKVW